MSNVEIVEPAVNWDYLNVVKARQQTMWVSGDFAVIGTTLQIVGELLCEGMDPRGGAGGWRGRPPPATPRWRGLGGLPPSRPPTMCQRSWSADAGGRKRKGL